jgi:Domain of unknown function (DUF1839)
MSGSTVRGLLSLSGKDPADYQRHALHSAERTYLETNCYADVVAELLHGCGYEPIAMFAHVVRMDFEGDQWTFFKPPPEDVELLYGIDIHEMQPYRPLPIQIGEQLQLGRTLIVELDSWYLPDTASTSYRTEHVKTSVAPDAIDPDAERMHYFHGPGLFELAGEDYRGVFRIGEFSDDVLPPYTELARFDAGPKLEGDALREAALITLRRSLSHRPPDNPVDRFGAALSRELPALREADLAEYHAYAFATVRILGSGFEALGSYAEWMFGTDGNAAIAPIAEVVDASKALSFRLARRREFDPQELLTRLADGWDGALAALSTLAA